jgi:hypothetical protein
MARLMRIIAMILVAFSLTSFLLYRQVLLINRRDQQRVQSSRIAIPEVKTAEGVIDDVDPEGHALTLIDGDERVTFELDDGTSIIDSGQVVTPASVTTGSSASVRYTQQKGKNHARKIVLVRGG